MRFQIFFPMTFRGDPGRKYDLESPSSSGGLNLERFEIVDSKS